MTSSSSELQGYWKLLPILEDILPDLSDNRNHIDISGIATLPLSPLSEWLPVCQDYELYKGSHCDGKGDHNLRPNLSSDYYYSGLIISKSKFEIRRCGIFFLLFLLVHRSIWSNALKCIFHEDTWSTDRLQHKLTHYSRYWYMWYLGSAQCDLHSWLMATFHFLHEFIFFVLSFRIVSKCHILRP